MTKKLIVTDLDGTLLKDDKSISDYTIEVLNRVRQEGHVFVIATARPLRAAKEFLKKVEIDAGIYHNGALIYKSGKQIDGFQICDPKSVVDKILRLNPMVSIAVESNDVLYSNFNAEEFWPGTSYVLTQACFEELIDKKADKIIVAVSSIEEMKRYESCLTDDLYIQLSENKIGMIMKKDANKRNGVSFLAKEFGIEKKNIIAFGDDYNDIDMIKYAGTGICVYNGLQEVKDISDIVCQSNEENGVARWIEDNI